MHATRNIILLLVPLFALSACVTTTGEKSPRFALEQALLADSHARRLPPAALRKAVASELQALDNATAGTLNNWQGPKDTAGTVIPGTPFEISGRICRRYDHRITISGDTRTRTATVCRNETGAWETLS